MSILKITYLIVLATVASHRAIAQTADSDPIKTHMESVSPGNLLPDNSLLLGVNGDSTFFHQLKGQWLLLDYWSTSCRPCIKEMPYLKELQKRYQSKGLRIVMINLDKKEKKWKRGLKLYNPPGPNYTTNRSVSNAFFALNLVKMTSPDGEQSIVTLMPQYVLISPEGEITDKEMPKPSDPLFHEKLNQYMMRASPERGNR